MANANAALLAKLDLIYCGGVVPAPPQSEGGVQSRRMTVEVTPVPPSAAFTAYPTTPLPFDDNVLAGTPATGDAARSQAAAMAAFARLVNFIPDADRYAATGTYVWDLYKRVLNEAEIGTIAQNDDALRRFEAARQYLFRHGTDADGAPILVDSPQYARYRVCQRAYRDADAACREAEVRAAYADDPAVRAAAAGDLSQLRDARRQTLIDWAAAGFKAEVEHHLAVLTSSVAGSAAAAWQQGREDFTAAARLDLFGASYLLTTLPSVDLANIQWMRFTLTPAEVSSLARLRPGGGSSPRIESFEMEICSLPIIRSWFAPALLSGGFWRWRNKPLSDGGVPARGLLPSYPREILIARNVRVVASAGDAGGLGSVITANDGLQLAGFVCQRLPLLPDPLPAYFSSH